MPSDDEGLGPGIWLFYFMVAAAVAGIASFWPDEPIAVFIAGIGGIAFVGIMHYQLKKKD